MSPDMEGNNGRDCKNPKMSLDKSLYEALKSCLKQCFEMHCIGVYTISMFLGLISLALMLIMCRTQMEQNTARLKMHHGQHS
jgi:hypothetical protein